MTKETLDMANALMYKIVAMENFIGAMSSDDEKETAVMIMRIDRVPYSKSGYDLITPVYTLNYEEILAIKKILMKEMASIQDEFDKL